MEEMTPKQLRTALDQLNLSQVGLGRLLGVTGRSVRGWISGGQRIPEPVAILIRLLLDGKITTADIEAVRKVSRPRKAKHPGSIEP
jgi:hypothetical protein